MSRMMESAAPGRPDLWRATLAGLCASLVGIGLARFAYTPLLPAIVGHGWFDPGAAAYLGAANLAGYLAGVVGAGLAARRIPARRLLRGATALAALSFFACAHPAGYAWFFAVRLLSGIAGGIAMVLAAPTVLSHVPPSRRGLASGAIFMGVGIGVLASGTLVPLLLHQGLTQAWLGLGVLASLLAVVGWNGCPEPAAIPAALTQHAPADRLWTRELIGVYLVYALNAFGLVPHMVFLVDYVARGLGQGLDTGGQYWELFGLGAIVGPIAAGHLADRIGYRTTLRLVLAMEIAFVILPALNLGPAWLMVSTLAVGACTIGIVPLALGRTREILHHHPSLQGPAWRTATTGFALFQAGGAYALSFVFSRTGDYRLLFALGAGAMGLALAADLITGAGRRTA